MALFSKNEMTGGDGLRDFPTPLPESPGQREAYVRKDIENRLRRACADLSEAEFQELVAAMTREQLRSERLP